MSETTAQTDLTVSEIAALLSVSARASFADAASPAPLELAESAEAESAEAEALVLPALQPHPPAEPRSSEGVHCARVLRVLDGAPDPDPLAFSEHISDPLGVNEHISLPQIAVPHSEGRQSPKPHGDEVTLVLPSIAQIKSRRPSHSEALGKALKQLGADEDEVKRATALKRLGVTEGDLADATYLFSQQGLVGGEGGLSKKEALLGATLEQQRRAKALQLLSTTEELVHVDAQIKLGQLGAHRSPV